MTAPSRGSALALLLCAPLAGARPQDALDRARAASAEGRYDVALDSVRELEDEALAAEWTSYLYGVAGDLPGSLREARAGLAVAPEHAGLLGQALNAALALGLAESSDELARRLVAASAGADEAQIARARQLAVHARDLVERDTLAARGVARARALALAGLAASVLALAALARRGARDTGAQ